MAAKGFQTSSRPASPSVRGPRRAAFAPRAAAEIDALVRAGVALAVAGAALYLIARAVNQLVPAEPSADFDPGGERNPFAWATSVATFGTAFAAALHALTSRWRRPWFTALAGACAFLSLGDAVELHERAGAKVFRDGLGLPDLVADQAELLLYAPVFGVTVLIVWALADRVALRLRRLGRVALVTLGAAIAFELLGIVTRQLDDQGVVNQVRNGLEDATEIAGWTLLATFTAAVLCTTWTRRRPEATLPPDPFGP